MNKVSKIISVALVLIMALLVMVMPTSAAGYTVNIDVEAVSQGVNEYTGTEYYKFNAYIDSTHSMVQFDIAISWDSAIWQPLRYSNKKVSEDPGRWVDVTDPENMMFDACEEYVTYGYGGDIGDGFEHDDTNGGVAYMPLDGGEASAAELSAANMGSELTAAGYQGMLYSWECDFKKNTMNVSGGTINGANSIVSGKVLVLSWYMALEEGVAPGEYVVGVQDKQAMKAVCSLTTLDAIGSKDVGTNYITSDGNATMNYNNATVTVAEAKSPVVAKTSQIRYNGPIDGDYAPFDVRTRAALSVDDFNALCTYDAATKATNIDKVGFVYADSSVGMTLENAAKVIGGTAVAGYVDVPVEHIQKTATEYVWTCLLEDAAYADAVDSVGYIVVDGKTYLFDAVYATDFSTLYEAQKTHIPTA